ncbi:unnamed protein product, partial [Rotaria sp. Silwood1]
GRFGRDRARGSGGRARGGSGEVGSINNGNNIQTRRATC